MVHYVQQEDGAYRYLATPPETTLKLAVPEGQTLARYAARCGWAKSEAQQAGGAGVELETLPLWGVESEELRTWKDEQLAHPLREQPTEREGVEDGKVGKIIARCNIYALGFEYPICTFTKATGDSARRTPAPSK